MISEQFEALQEKQRVVTKLVKLDKTGRLKHFQRCKDGGKFKKAHTIKDMRRT